jgi:hypothetical protein
MLIMISIKMLLLFFLSLKENGNLKNKKYAHSISIHYIIECCQYNIIIYYLRNGYYVRRSEEI